MSDKVACRVLRNFWINGTHHVPGSVVQMTVEDLRAMADGFVERCDSEDGAKTFGYAIADELRDKTVLLSGQLAATHKAKDELEVALGKARSRIAELEKALTDATAPRQKPRAKGETKE